MIIIYHLFVKHLLFPDGSWRYLDGHGKETNLLCCIVWIKLFWFVNCGLKLAYSVNLALCGLLKMAL